MSASTAAKPPRFRVVGGKDSLVARVVGEIERQIADGRVAVETALPPERELAERLAVSRPSGGARGGPDVGARALTRREVVEPLALYLKSGSESV